MSFYENLLTHFIIAVVCVLIMRLISLEITNFRVLKSAKIDFPDKVIAIVGKNGAGKSSIIEAISWALYGNQAARSGKDEIKSTFATEKENCEVKVVFYVNEEQYTVIRRLVGRSNRAEVELFRGEKSESVGVNETKSHVGNLLGLDWRGFLSSFLARQSELNALSDLVPSKRKDHIAGMLGIERLDKAMIALKQDTKLYKEKVALLERSLSEKDTIDRFVEELQAKLVTIESQLVPQSSLFKKAKVSFENAKTSYDKCSENKIQFLKAESSLKAEQTTLELLQEQVQNLVKEKSELAQIETLLKELSLKQDDLKEVPSKLEKCKLLKSNKKYADDLKSQEQILKQQIEQGKQSISQLKIKIRQFETQLVKFPENLEDNLKNQKLSLDDKRSQYSSSKTELDRLKLDISKLESQLNNISSLKSESVCEKCHRPLGDDFEAFKIHIEDEIKALQEQLLTKSKSLEMLKKDGEELKKSSDFLEQQHKERLLLIPALESLKKENNQFEKLEKDALNQKENIAKKLLEIGDVSFDPSILESLLKQNQQFEKNLSEISRYKGQLARLPILAIDIEKSNSKILSTSQLIETTIDNIKSIGYNEEEFVKVTEQFNKAQELLEESKNSLFEIQKAKELTTLSLQEKQQQQAIFKKSEAEFEENKTSHYYGEKLGSLFTQYRHDLIASIRPILADFSSRMFNEMTANKYNLVELDEKYELRVMDGGQFYGVDRFSGGEKDLANLCLRLAISLALTESAGLSRSFIILDEVFGSQDNERKELILSSLANLKNRFPQIILITHIEDIKDGVEQIIEVKQTEFGHSEVTVNGS